MYETARALAWERRHHGDQLSTVMRDLIDRGSGVAPDDYDAARALTDEWRRRADEVFDDADLVLTPAALGEAPAGLEQTGDPRFAWTWTLLGWPSLSVPGLVGGSGLPLGVQLVAREHDDARVLAAGAWLAPLLSASRSA
jgi:Asp-tRNA(Asn)/Glu-tRNA(Gln) amidotransferase A subunit family amidase